jgi:hypothetical protein
MADVSVTFGATDEGLEKTLKALQSETDQLKLKMRTTEMSVTEAGAAMKKIAQNNDLEKKLRQVGDESQGASSKVKTLGTTAEDTGKKAEIGFGKIAVGATLAGAAAKLGSMAIDAAFSAATKTIASFGDALNMGGRLNDLADRTGIAVDKVLLLERAFQNAGVGADSLGPILNKMQKALVDAEDGTSKAAYAFADLGLSLSQLRGLSPEEQLRTIGKAIAAIPDPAQRAATAMEIFGKSGGALNQVFANFDDEIKTAKLQLGSLPDIMKAGSSQFDRISDNLVVVGGKFIEFAAGLIDKVKPALDAVTTALSMFDAAKVGQEIGEFFVGAGNGMKLFQKAVDEFKTGNFTDGFKLAWEAIVQQAKDTANSIYVNIVAAFKTVGDFIKDQFVSSGPLVMAITSAFDYVSGYIKKVVAGSLFETFTSLGPAFSRIADGLKQSSEAGSKSAELALQRIPVAVELAAEKASESMGDIPANFKKNMADVTPLFDKVTDKQSDVVEKTQDIIDADKEWEAQAMDRINKDVDASQKAFAEKKANQQTLATNQTAEDERADNAEKARQEKLKESAALKRDEVALQLKINEAIASGNTKELERLKGETALNKSIQDMIKSGMGEEEATKLANELERASRAADRTKNSLATKIGADIKSRQEAEAVDPGGKLMKKAQEQIAAGRYGAAEATARQIKTREQEAMIRGTGKGRDTRALQDIARDYGLDKKNLSQSQLRDELYKIRTEGQGTSDKVKKTLETTQKRMGEGMKKEAEKKVEEKKTPMTLEGMVKIIQDAVVKLEMKLPQPVMV